LQVEMDSLLFLISPINQNYVKNYNVDEGR